MRASAFALLAAHGAVRVDGDRSLAQAGIGFCTGRIWYNTRRTRGTSFPIGDPAAQRVINHGKNSMITIEIHNFIITYNYRRVNRYMFVSSSVRRSIGFFPFALPSFCLLQHIIQTITPFSAFCVQSIAETEGQAQHPSRWRERPRIETASRKPPHPFDFRHLSLELERVESS